MPTLRKFLEKINIDAEIDFDEPMANHTSFRIGGPADALVLPRSTDDLARLLVAAESEGIPVAVIGGGANLLVAGDRVAGQVAGTGLVWPGICRGPPWVSGRCSLHERSLL